MAVILILFIMVAVPFVTAYGVITGKLDIETLDPVKKQVREETMIQGGFGGY